MKMSWSSVRSIGGRNWCSIRSSLWAVRCAVGAISTVASVASMMRIIMMAVLWVVVGICMVGIWVISIIICRCWASVGRSM